MLLPDGTILVHTDENGFTHAYDPVKAHEYYMRTRKLKGRKKGATKEDPKKRKPAAKQDPVKMKAAWENFLKGLPLAQEGMPLPEVEKFVQSLRGKSDDELKAEITKLKAADAKSAHPSPKGGLHAMTVEKILANRQKSSTPTSAQKKKLSPKERAVQLTNVKRRISNIRAEIRDLEQKLKKQEAEERQSKAKAKKGPTRAEKSKSAREAKKYRDKNQQKLKSKAKAGDTKKESAKKTVTAAALRDKITIAKGSLEIELNRQRELSQSK